MAALFRAIYTNKLYPPADPTHLSFAGRTILVTGSNTGLGAQAVHKFASQGAARLILAVRDLEKGAKVQRTVQHVVWEPKCKVDVWHLDMMDYESIKSFARRCEVELDQLDIALLNAGVYMTEYNGSEYGWEQTLQVNTLSTVLLALLLLPKLRESKSADYTPVLEFVSSGRHRAAKITDTQKEDSSVRLLEAFNQSGSFSSGRSYQTSKLFLMYAMQTLAAATQPDAAEPPTVFVTSVCPGACQSDLARGVDSLVMNGAKSIANSLFLRTSEEGSRTFISGADLEQKGHGVFWQNDIIRDPPELLVGETGEQLRARVWNEIVEALSKDVPEVRNLADKIASSKVSSL